MAQNFFQLPKLGNGRQQSGTGNEQVKKRKGGWAVSQQRAAMAAGTYWYGKADEQAEPNLT